MLRSLAACVVLLAAATPALASDLADGPDARAVGRLIREGRHAEAHAICKRRAAEAARDPGHRWRDLEAHFREHGSGWSGIVGIRLDDAGLADVGSGEALVAAEARLQLEEARVPRDLHALRVAGVDVARARRARGLSLLLAERPVEALPLLEQPVWSERPDRCRELAEAARAFAADPRDDAARVRLGAALVRIDTDAARVGSRLLRRALQREDVAASAESLAAAAAAALAAHDASDARAAFHAWFTRDPEAAAAGLIAWYRARESVPDPMDDPFVSRLAEAVGERPMNPALRIRLAESCARFAPHVAERLLRRLAAHVPPRVDVSVRDDLAAQVAIDARRRLALLCERRGAYEEALSLWTGVSPLATCGNCAIGENLERDCGLARCEIQLGRAATVLARARSEIARAWDESGEFGWGVVAVEAMAATGELASLEPSDDGLGRVVRTVQMRTRGDIDGLVDDLMNTPDPRHHLPTPGARSETEHALERRGPAATFVLHQLRAIGGAEVPVLLRRFDAPPPVPPWDPLECIGYPKVQRHPRAWVAVALANSKSPAAGEALRGLLARARRGEDLGVSVEALEGAIELHGNDLLWIL